MPFASSVYGTGARRAATTATATGGRCGRFCGFEQDATATGPRFSATADEVKKKDIKDFQLYYALNTLKRLAPAGTAAAANSEHKS